MQIGYRTVQEFINGIISDDIPEVLTNCNKVAVMKMGRIVGQYKSSELTNESLAEMLTE